VNSWHTIVWNVHRIPGETACSGQPCDYYDSLLIDGVNVTPNGGFTPQPSGPSGDADNTGTDTQIDLNSTGGTAIEYLDELGFDAYNFADLDTNLLDAKTLGVDVLFTWSTTPNFVSSDPTNATCNYNTTATGGCGVPTDIALVCTNTNAARNCDGKVDGTNQTWRNFVYAAANHMSGSIGKTKIRFGMGTGAENRVSLVVKKHSVWFKKGS